MTETANTVVDLLRDGASSDNRGSRQLLRDGSWTGHPYAALWERSGCIATVLRRRGFRDGSPLVAVVDDPGGFLVPLTLSENFRMLRDVGFTHVDVFMKMYNFTGILAIKMGSGETKSWDSDDQD